MKIEVRNRCSDFTGYRAARVKSLFNVETGANFSLDADLPIENDDWKIGVIVGPSGSGKSSLGNRIFGEKFVADIASGWPENAPIIDGIAPSGSFNDATNALAAVGLGNVPSWLRPFHVLSGGEKFRAGVARLVCEQPKQVVVDEWTSVIDRRVAQIGSLAFAKSWRRTNGKAVLLSCHYDVLDWIQPDWIFDTATGKFNGECLWRRPPIKVEIRVTDWRFWPFFEPHHYLKMPHMVASKCYVGFVDGNPVAHLGVSPHFHMSAFRASRLVILPEWQGAGIGVRFLNEVCRLHLNGKNRWSRKLPTYFSTSHPGLCSALRRDANWTQVSAALAGANKARSVSSFAKSELRKKVSEGKPFRKSDLLMRSAGFGGHFRAVQGFKFTGAAL